MASAAAQITDAANGRSSRKAPSAASFKKLTAELETKDAKLQRLQTTMKTVKANSGKAATEIMVAGEGVLAAGASSFLSGAAGKYRKYVRGVRGLTALVLGGWGIARTLQGKSGEHQLAIGTGLATAEAVEATYDYGRKLNQEKGWFSIEGAVQGAGSGAGTSVSGVGDAPEIAVTPGAGGGGPSRVRELMPADSHLEEFRARARSMAS